MQRSDSGDTRLVPGVGRMPYPAYRGKDPYIFVSYAHMDSDRVFADIRRFNEAGYNVWYDEGIAPGSEWPDDIADRLSECAVFVVMITGNSAPRENVQNEIDYALNEGKPFLAIHLEETELPRGLKLRISRKQAILRYNMTDEEYEFKFTEAFTRFGLVRKQQMESAKGSARASDTAQVSAAASAVPASSAQAGAHQWGDFVPQGTAYIKTAGGQTVTAVADSLALYVSALVRFRAGSSGEMLYDGLDSPSNDPQYDGGDMIRFRDMQSVEKAPDGLFVRDTSGNSTLIKTVYGQKLWYIGERDGIEPSSVDISEIESITFERTADPGFTVRYCDIRLKDGSFRSPKAYVWFLINERDGAPPLMKLRKDLSRFAGKNIPLLMMKKLEVNGASGESGLRTLDVTVTMDSGEEIPLKLEGYYSFFAMSAAGRIREIDREDLKAIAVL